MKTNPDESDSGLQVDNQSISSTPAIWNPYVAGTWSIFFTPIFGSALILLNWRTLEVKEQNRGAQI